MTIEELFTPKHRLMAAAHSIDRYERATTRHFEDEDRLRAEGWDWEADVHHRMGLIAGHAAYLELANPEPRA
jgi:hypothetical protein